MAVVVMDSIKKYPHKGRHLFVLFLIVLIVAAGAFGYLYRANIVNEYQTILAMFAPVKPCSQPIVYTLGTFDTQFGLSKTDFLTDIDDAVHVWDDPFIRTFFVYGGTVNPATGQLWSATAKNTLTINLVYDFRQKATTDMSAINSTITTDSTTYANLKSQFDSLTANYNDQKSRFDSLQTTYTTQKASYDQEVAYWNAKGGAPAADYATLEQQRQDLNSQIDTLNEMQDSINTLGDSINNLAAQINDTAHGLNTNVDQYNKIGATTGSQFEEGEYVQDANGRHINIYQYNDQDKLIRVLAHELGHSLGMNHVQDPNSIMYALNEGAGGSITQDDIDELKRVCGIM